MAYSGAFRAKSGKPDERVGEPAPAPSSARKNRKPVLDFGDLFQKTEVAGMETDDLLLALVLYLMYRESGDTDLLIMLGVILLT